MSINNKPCKLTSIYFLTHCPCCVFLSYKPTLPIVIHPERLLWNVCPWNKKNTFPRWWQAEDPLCLSCTFTFPSSSPALLNSLVLGERSVIAVSLLICDLNHCCELRVFDLLSFPRASTIWLLTQFNSLSLLISNSVNEDEFPAVTNMT